MVSFKNLFLFAVTATSLAVEPRVVEVNALQARAEADILNNLKSINSLTKTLDTSIKNWNGQLGTVAPIQQNSDNLLKKIKSATTDTKKEGKKNSTTSKNILAYVNGTLIPTIKTTLNDLVAKKAQVTKAGITNIVLNDLKDLKSATDALGAALKAIASSDQTANAQKAIDTIDSLFNSAIKAFS